MGHVFHGHGVATNVMPQQTLRRMLVHLKDKCEVRDKAGIVYQIPCTRETGRRFRTQKKEHRRDVNFLK